MHKREYKELFGAWPEDYDLVRERLGKPTPANDNNQLTLWEALTDPEQASLPWS